MYVFHVNHEQKIHHDYFLCIALVYLELIMILAPLFL